MLVKAIATFPYAHDGVNVRFVHEGEEFECRDDLAPGLSGAGKIDGQAHGLPLLDEHRRAAIIEKLATAMRAELATLDDERLMAMSAGLDEEMARRANTAEEEADVEAAAEPAAAAGVQAEANTVAAQPAPAPAVAPAPPKRAAARKPAAKKAKAQA